MRKCDAVGRSGDASLVEATRSRAMTRKHFAIVACLFVAACREDRPTSYQDMDFDQRHAYMSEVVLPAMKDTFVVFDAEYASMSCVTCHGDGAIDGSYAMPSPQLPLLPASEEAFLEYLEADPEHARWSQFMVDEVWPQMAELLDAPLYDEKTPDGFSCSNCHMHEGQ
jgi:hypothetical protein